MTRVGPNKDLENGSGWSGLTATRVATSALNRQLTVKRFSDVKISYFRRPWPKAL